MIAVEAPGWQGATKAHTAGTLTEPQRSQPGLKIRQILAAGIETAARPTKKVRVVFQILCPISEMGFRAEPLSAAESRPIIVRRLPDQLPDSGLRVADV